MDRRLRKLAEQLDATLLTVEGIQHTAAWYGNACVDDIVSVLTGDAAEWQQRAAKRPEPTTRWDSILIMLLVFAVFGFVFLTLVGTIPRNGGRGRSRGGWSSGSSAGSGWSSGSSDGGFSGGGFSGGGGSFGGGGSSGSW